MKSLFSEPEVLCEVKNLLYSLDSSLQPEGIRDGRWHWKSLVTDTGWAMSKVWKATHLPIFTLGKSHLLTVLL